MTELYSRFKETMPYVFLFSLMMLFSHGYCAYPNQAKSEEQLIHHVQQCIENAERGVSKITPEILELSGMSSPKVRHFLNNLCSLPDTHYLEIGSWGGSTWISALYGNQNAILSATAIDDWSQFNGSQKRFTDNCDRFLSLVPYQFKCKDCFKVNPKEFQNKINVYFYDGEHSFKSQEKAFTHFDSALDNLFIAVVDDWNWDEVRKGTYSAFNKLHYEILYEVALPARYNGDTEEWWNGLYVAVLRKL